MSALHAPGVLAAVPPAQGARVARAGCAAAARTLGAPLRGALVTALALWLGGGGLMAQQTARPAPKKKPVHHARVHAPAASHGMAPVRARQIQDALIHAGYLESASGRWDAATAAAMKKFQADHHWQVRFVPDARALIALGLGPGTPY